MQNSMLLIARTDAESARLLSSTIDIRDHPYVRGVATRGADGKRRKGLAEVLDEAEAKGLSGAEVDKLETQWLAESELLTFDEGAIILFPYVVCGTEILIHWCVAAVEKAIQSASSISSDSKASVLEQYRSASAGKSNTDAREIAAGILGEQIDWNWDR